jgi:hypothetical protein
VRVRLEEQEFNEQSDIAPGADSVPKSQLSSMTVTAEVRTALGFWSEAPRDGIWRGLECRARAVRSGEPGLSFLVELLHGRS